MSRPPILIMGTAGHVDHGKTTLVKALTGVDLDTLPEEKARGLTINLGFTSFETPSGLRIGVVDVPGHRRFIKTMLAGAHGIDFVLFLVAADDSVMPQTREHLHILRLLGIQHGLIALTKIDMVDRELLELAEAETRELVAGTFLESAPIIPVSSITGEGMAELVAAIDELAKTLRPRERGSYFRMFIDRAFTVAGAGTVVTGTAISGSVSPGDELELLPGGEKARVRKIEIHGEPAERARAGQRTALNLRLTEKAEVRRGLMVATPGVIRPTYMVDAKLEVLPDYPKPLKHWTRARFYLGTAEAFGRVVLLDRNEAAPGEQTFIQFRLESPVPAVIGDPFILRDFSGSWTIGGGRILDAHPRKHKRKKALAVSDLERREKGYLEEVVELEVRKAGYFITRTEVANNLDAPLDRTGAAAAELARQGKVIILPPEKSPWLIHQEAWERLKKKIIGILKEHHQALPQLETGLSEQELRERASRAAGFAFPEEPFRHALLRMVEEKALKEVDSTFALSSHAASLAAEDEAALSRIRAAFSENPLKPPSLEEIYENARLPRQVVRDFLDRLLEKGELVRVSREFLFERSAVEQVREQVLNFLKEKGAITVAEFRDLAGTTRKYAIPLLNYFDQEGLTVREGDVRRLRQRA